MTDVVSAFSKARIDRYRLPGEGDGAALDRYFDNCRVIGRFYLPLNVFEIVTRNGCAAQLTYSYGERWFDDRRLKSWLKPHYRNAVEKAVADIQSEDLPVVSDRVISMMTLGFWSHVTTRRAQVDIWRRGWKINFPNGFAAGKQLADLHAVIERTRDIRNRAFHHYAVFDRNVDQLIEDLVEAVGWRSSGARERLRRELAR